MRKELLELNNISKKYGNKLILDNVSLSVLRRETLAIIGANGCGKSTLLRIIAGLSPISGGTRTAGTASIGYVPECFPKLPFNPVEYLLFMGKIQGLSEQVVHKRSQELFEVYDISAAMQKTWIRDLSKGTIQKIAVMQAILTQPDLLILDEPLSGQDEKSQTEFIHMLKDFKGQGVSIVLACHERHLVKELAEKSVEIKDAGITINKVDSYMVICAKVDQGLADALKDFSGVQDIFIINDIFTVHVAMENSDHILAKIIAAGGSIYSVTPSNKITDGISQAKEKRCCDF